MSHVQAAADVTAALSCEQSAAVTSENHPRQSSLPHQTPELLTACDSNVGPDKLLLHLLDESQTRIHPLVL